VPKFYGPVVDDGEQLAGDRLDFAFMSVSSIKARFPAASHSFRTAFGGPA
jgi:hypothetical protein